MTGTMAKRSMGLSRWLLLAGLSCLSRLSNCQSVPPTFENTTGLSESRARSRAFSPRMNYDEWTPLGPGDPLKNKPTFYYVPPKLDRVQYWLDSHTTEPSTKRDILVLGVTAKKTSPKIPEQFLKLNRDTTYSNDFTGSTGAEPPKIARPANFRNGNQNVNIQASGYYPPSSYYDRRTKPPPYTMMLPPPIVDKPVQLEQPSSAFDGGIVHYQSSPGNAQFSTQTEEGPLLRDRLVYPYYRAPSPLASPSRPPYPPSASKIETIEPPPPPSGATKTRYDATTAPSVSFEKSNLIYQSSQTFSGGSTSGFLETSRPAWNTPASASASIDHFETDNHASASSNHEVVVGHNANIVVDGDDNENEEVVIGQKETPTPPTSILSTSTTTVVSSTSTSEESVDEAEKMHIVMANSPSSDAEADRGPVTVVMPVNYADEKNTSASTSASNVSAIHDGGVSTTEKIIVTSPSSFAEHPTSSPVPNGQMSLNGQRHRTQMNRQTPPPMSQPSRHPGSPPRGFVHSQMAPSQPGMHLAGRPPIHGGMHGGTMHARPGAAFRPPVSHVSPPMAHVHAPPAPLKAVMGSPVSPEIFHERLHQLGHFGGNFVPSPMSSSFSPMTPASFSSSSIPSSFSFSLSSSSSPSPSVSMMESPDRYRSSRPPESTTFASSTLSSASSLSSVTSSSMEPWMETEDPSRPSSSSTLQQLLGNESSTSPPRTTTVPSLTTDPIFSHYKQPAKPAKGPMYLIIQGHSKVKTYKPTIGGGKHGLPIANQIVTESVTERKLSKLERLIEENTKAAAAETRKKQQQRLLEEKRQTEKRVAASRDDALMSLVENGLAGFTLPPSSTSTNGATTLDPIEN